ncbi:branched-chain amino acid ABC transporter permease [Celeribacter baekdonensis]|uniref:ABC transporter permease n=1 Tax=Celeribacter baekdonensis B30 TaxID=1208323 RepID=K2JF98_9RHOB|nr:branched-chain amino acid ABC transporter permease [Celeribacter baekdonensis]EKE69299.1 ABC transporter permease [Celeribacter baekdonensis B30]
MAESQIVPPRPYARTSSAALPLFAFAVILAALITLPFWATGYTQRSVLEFLYFLALAQAWNLMAGYAGMMSIGQQAFVGIGAYGLVVMAEDLGINPFLTVPLAAILAVILAVPVSWLLFRLKGAYFAVATWVIAETVRLTVNANIDWLGGGRGRTVRSLGQFDRHLREDLGYWVALALAIIAVFGVFFLLRSKTGLALQAIRDTENGARSVGVETRRTKRIVYLFAAAIAGATGALIYIVQINVRPDAAFSINWAAYVIFIVVIGGIGTIEGPILGTLVFFFLRGMLADLEAWSMLIFGLIAIMMMLFAPKGLWGLLNTHRPVLLFRTARRLPERFAPQKEGE